MDKPKNGFALSSDHGVKSKQYEKEINILINKFKLIYIEQPSVLDFNLIESFIRDYFNLILLIEDESIKFMLNNIFITIHSFIIEKISYEIIYLYINTHSKQKFDLIVKSHLYIVKISKINQSFIDYHNNILDKFIDAIIDEHLQYKEIILILLGNIRH